MLNNDIFISKFIFIFKSIFKNQMFQRRGLFRRSFNQDGNLQWADVSVLFAL